MDEILKDKLKAIIRLGKCAEQTLQELEDTQELRDARRAEAEALGKKAGEMAGRLRFTIF